MPSTTTTYPGTSPYSALWGYSRAVRRGSAIHVSGTTSVSPTPPHDILHASSAYDQTLTIFAEIVRAVEALGGKKTDIVRVRMFVRDDEDAEEVGEGMRAALYAEEAGKQVGGWAATMLVGCRMVHKDMRVEIEVEAIVSEE